MGRRSGRITPLLAITIAQDHVLQLPHIADHSWPMSRSSALGPQPALAELDRVLGEEVRHEQRDVAAPLVQWRQRQGNDVSAGRTGPRGSVARASSSRSRVR